MPLNYQTRLAAVRASYTAAKRADEAHHDLPAYYIYRPLADWITPFFWAAGWSANAVSALSLGLALLLPALALLGGLAGAGAVVTACLLFQVLDCVDGSLARVTGRLTRVGALLDGISSLLYWAAYFAAAGLLAQGEPGGLLAAHGRELGLGLALLLFMQRELEDTYDGYFAERVRWQPPVPGAPQIDLARWGKVAEQAVAFGGLLLAAGLGRLGYFLALLALYQGTLFVVWLPRFLRALWARRAE